ncbi:proton-coupled amino acid transporter-like protein pathetic isoform X2 [Leguminivora glycinivorella]|uniref:proton-coupled amino acid transporter-like protein pathetic isoform X2 n=1 Tax=Leguminivora glycinivorella TaxID=1035111 RepID=UPI00200DA4A8|nr:proton-coupled amino acid transporter-like protein pathetic isoform X2 [Leguminivora glycinivorella]
MSRPPITVKATGEEARSYDYAAARGPIKTTNVIESIGHLVKSCLGGGVVGIHEAYKGCGLLSALVMNVILGLFVGYCMNMLVKNAQIMYGRLQIPKMSYPDVAEATIATCPFPKMRKFARPVRYAVDVTIGIDLFGSCCVYGVIIARSLQQLLVDSKTVDHINLRLLIACLLIPCIVICWITQLKYLAPFSIVADCFIVLVAVSTVYYGSAAATKSPIDFPLVKSFEGFFEFLGVCVFSMEGVGVSMPIENHMTNPRKFPLVLVGGMGVVISIVMIIGFFGYWGFGEDARAPITNNFPWSTFPIVLKVLMAVMVYVTFALNFWVPFDLVWYYLKRRHPEDKLWFWERVYRTITVILIFLVAIIFPDVSAFMGFLGCFCLSLMGFIIPAFIELCVVWDDPGLGVMKWRLIKSVAIIVFGVCLFFVGTYSNVKAMVQSAVSGGEEAGKETTTTTAKGP